MFELLVDSISTDWSPWLFFRSRIRIATGGYPPRKPLLPCCSLARPRARQAERNIQSNATTERKRDRGHAPRQVTCLELWLCFGQRASALWRAIAAALRAYPAPTVECLKMHCPTAMGICPLSTLQARTRRRCFQTSLRTRLIS